LWHPDPQGRQQPRVAVEAERQDERTARVVAPIQCVSSFDHRRTTASPLGS
jgi:hypothetical protein